MRKDPGHRPRLLIFDWDGTLMDSVGAIVGCMQAVAERVGLARVPAEAIRQAIGLGLEDTLSMLLPEAGNGLRLRVLEEYRDLWFSGFRQRQRPFAGVGEALADLHAEDYLLAVATGKSRRGLDRDLRVTGLGRFFCATRTGDEAFPKPHPAMVEDLLEETGSRPWESLVIGDTVHDLEMAQNAGVEAVAVTCGAQDREQLSAREPLGLLGSVMELKGWLDERRENSAA